MRFPFEIPNTAEVDVVGFGTNAVDHLVRVAQFPAAGSKVELKKYAVCPGGEVASTMAGLARLGLRTAYAGRFGDDEEGKLGLSSLSDEGIDHQWAEVIGTARTQIAFIVIEETSGERTIMWQRDRRLAYTSAEAPVAIASRGRILHMTPHDTGACIRMARAAKETGTIVSLDVDNVFEGIEELLPLIDICIGSADFPDKLTGITDNDAALNEIVSRFGCRVAAMTLGQKGSLVVCHGRTIETGGFSVPGGCVDTTGAGDAFRAGFLYGVLMGLSVEESAWTANAVAALKCRKTGARAGLPNKEELQELLSRPNGFRDSP